MKFGGVTALNDVTFDVKKQEILGLIGPNGAGKTTVFNVITGVYQITSGEISFDGNSSLELSVTGSPKEVLHVHSRTFDSGVT